MNQNPELPTSTLVFKNIGSTPVTISNVKVLTNLGVITATAGNMAFEVLPRSQVSILLSNARSLFVRSVSLQMSGGYSDLEIFGVNLIGRIPSGFSAGN